MLYNFREVPVVSIILDSVLHKEVTLKSFFINFCQINDNGHILGIALFVLGTDLLKLPLTYLYY